MEKLKKLTDNILFQSCIGEERGLRVYSKPVSDRLGIPGLSKLVMEKTGQDLKADEGYVFFVRNQDVLKILVRDHRSKSVLEFYGLTADEIKEALAELG